MRGIHFRPVTQGIPGPRFDPGIEGQTESIRGRLTDRMMQRDARQQ